MGQSEKNKEGNKSEVMGRWEGFGFSRPRSRERGVQLDKANDNREK